MLQIRRPEPQPPTTGQILVRAATALAWFFVLTAFFYWIYIHLAQSACLGFYGAIFSAAIVAETVDRLWLAAAVPAAAFAVTWYTVSIARFRRDRCRARIELVGGLAVAIALNMLVWRVIPLAFLQCLADVGVSDVEARAYLGAPTSMPEVGFLGRTVGVAVLGGLFLLTAAWRGTAFHRGSRRGLIGAAAIMVLVIAVLPVFNLYPAVPHPFPGELWDQLDTPLVRFAIQEQAADAEQAWWIRASLITHDAEGRPRTASEVNRAQESAKPWWCDSCRLPVSNHASPLALAIDLTEELPTMERADLVVEIPLRGDQVRIYRASGTDYEMFPMEDLEGWVAPEDWLILKLDRATSTFESRLLLESLARAGVRRVTLATDPIAYVEQGMPIRVEFVDEAAVVDWSGHPGYARRYVAPPPPIRETCTPLPWLSDERWVLMAMRRVGPTRVVIEPAEPVAFQGMVLWLDRAAIAGVETVVFVIPEDG